MRENKRMKYKIIALCGKAGSGKDTILRHIVSTAPERFNEIISCTTRPMREGEVEGVNYFFLTDEEFEILESTGEMLETTEFNGWHYGTGLFALAKDKINVGVFNPAGLRKLRLNDAIDLDIFYITAPDKTRLIRQLDREKNPDCQEICRRYFTDKDDFCNLESEFPDITILNNNVGLINLGNCIHAVINKVNGYNGQEQLSLFE